MVRAPLKRHTTIALASASAPPPSAHPVKATDPTARPCHSPMTPSMSTTARLIQASHRAHRASCCQPASHATGTGQAGTDPWQRTSPTTPSPTGWVMVIR